MVFCLGEESTILRKCQEKEFVSLISPVEMDHFQLIQKKMGKRVKILSGDQLDLQGY